MRRLQEALGSGQTICTTGIVLQGILQGLRGPGDAARIVDLFGDIAMVVPTRDDHIDAAQLRNA